MSTKTASAPVLVQASGGVMRTCIFRLTQRGMSTHSPNGGVYGYSCRIMSYGPISRAACIACTRCREINVKPLWMHPHAVRPKAVRI